MSADPEIYAIRLGYGLSPLAAPPETIAAYLDSVERAGPDGSILGAERLQALHHQYKRDQGLASDGDKDAGVRAEELRRQFVQARTGLIQTRLARAVGDPAGFGERLVQFWSDHFSIATDNPIHSAFTLAFIDEAIRPHIGGKFADMMFAAETHPAMLSYLEQSRSVGPNSESSRRRGKKPKRGLNENLAREMIELHSLGAGADYTQNDVRQLAELLTGLKYDKGHSGIFIPEIAEPGAEVVLGRSYGGDGEASIDDIRAVIHDLATHETTALHLARKLAVHFVSDNPPEALTKRLAAVFRDSGGDLSAVNSALADSPELVTHFRQKVRQPFDFVVAGLRALGITEQNINGLSGGQIRKLVVVPLYQMGQRWSNPRGPDGWPEAAEDWATPPGLAARMNWAFDVPIKLRRVLPDPREFMTTALGSTASGALQWAVPKAESTREGVAVVLASSDFNRR